jgi:hypothetical protein
MKTQLDSIEEVLEISRLTMTEQTRTTSPAVKTEFTEVFTLSDLVDVSSTSTPDFPTVLTETSLLESPSLSPMPDDTDLAALYDETFPTLDTYRQFTTDKLYSYRNTLEFKYFNNLYTHHRQTTETIRHLRKKAQELLEEAHRLQANDFDRRRDLQEHVNTITRAELRKRIFNPKKPLPNTPVPSTKKPQPTSFPYATRPSFGSRSAQIVATPAHPPANRYNCPPPTPVCYQCSSPHHFRPQCPQYNCPYCNHRAPGHAQRDCPENPRNARRFDDGTRGYYDIGGEEDGNLGGEC